MENFLLSKIYAIRKKNLSLADSVYHLKTTFEQHKFLFILNSDTSLPHHAVQKA